MDSICPNCDFAIKLSGSVKLLQTVNCPLCGESLQVISLHPTELDYRLDEDDYISDEEEEI